MSTLLDQVRTLLKVDVDSMDPAVASRHTSDSAKFVDMTSNQAIVAGTVTPELLAEAVKVSGGGSVERVLDVLTVLLARRVLPHLTGNVHAQTSPSVGYSVEGTVNEARRIVTTFEELSVPRARVCIKIPITPEGAQACKILQDEGIQTLGTCVFGVEQAIAARLAGCVYLAPYFNELCVHFEEGVWKAYKVGVKGEEHPMMDVVRTIVTAYKTKGTKTKVMPARRVSFGIVTAQEVIALVALQPDHLTLSGAVLDELASLPPVPINQFDDILKHELTVEELKSAYIVVPWECPNRIYSCRTRLPSRRR
ncbi:aldolase [Guyanagaster necrorhizus]|uniref:Aldolase n=1 Tax=Guyanagaster necrorhizus TaxID=856835 RepID=A0A9P7W533_9AGAR|nr:aldolase [Guyanagaster necrorhizus MCA 3950]KAG7452739.1 aldolase [Guyanagaster necrorhizus MCA 3950]